MRLPDALVVGGGLVGTAVAWRLARRGLRVTLIDSAAAGSASRAAAGILCAQAEGEGPGPFFELLRAAEQAYPPLLAELGAAVGAGTAGLDVGYRTPGVVQVAVDGEALATLVAQRTWQAGQRRAGTRDDLAVEALGPADLARLEPGLSRDLVGGSFFPRAGQVDNRALLLALTAAARAAGVTLRQAQVTAISEAQGRATGVWVADERLSAGLLVIAAGAWSSQLAGLGLSPDAVRPVRGQILRFAPVPPPVTRVVFGADGYLVPRGADQLLVGSTMEPVGFAPQVTEAGRTLLRARAVRLCPALARATIDAEWAGLRPATADGLPALGPTPLAGLHLCVGLRRNGVLLAPLLSDLVARSALEDQVSIPTPFAALRLFQSAPAP